MAHPFFDVISYPWHRADAVKFYTDLYRSEPNSDRIDLIYKRCAVDLPPLPLEKPPDGIWKAALQQLTSARKLREFCRIAKAESSFAAIVTTIDSVISATDALTQFVLRTERKEITPFLNRRTLRSGLEQMVPADSSAGVIIVRGDPETGRSWTKYLVTSVASELGEGPPLYLYDGNVTSVGTALRHIFNALEKPKAIPKQNSSPNAWYADCFFEMQVIAGERAKAGRKRLWIVIDDLGETQYGPKLDPEIKGFFEQFALQMANGAFSQYFRLVLIEYPRGPVPTKWKRGSWLEDDTRESPPKTEDLADFLRQWGDDHNKAIGEDDAERLSKDILFKVKDANATDCHPAHWGRVYQELMLALKGL